ncbi:class I SAM-dependent methyltransferase [Mesorhizobium temperatum]|uniref:Methyltransferase type 11 domain-containing protein n=1 Tax=Mesorhizobium temperatum TaxID=241416 RepID=A0A271LJZ7_9HYPH|nr:class I SAM-dependent methyltransferase [Mesorhizobium temperatum]PAQ07656.1 hypothetical protein CIT26_20250 [Mesorhizobium temperatum]
MTGTIISLADRAEHESAAPYDVVARGYDSTRCADGRLVDSFLHHLRPAPQGRYVDVGCGTGNYLAAFSKRGLRMTGFDLSRAMLEVARTKAPDADFVLGTAEAMPFEDEEFAGGISCLAVHHFRDLDAAAKEMFRVLQPEGTFVIFTTERSQTDTFWLNGYFPELMRANESLMPPITRIVHALRQAGFSRVEVDTWLIPEDMIDYFLYGGKHQPEVYLSPDVRHGITRFRNAAPRDGVAEGCRRLENDIATGKIAKVIENYPSRCGDYTFIVATKEP